MAFNPLTYQQNGVCLRKWIEFHPIIHGKIIKQERMNIINKELVVTTSAYYEARVMANMIRAQRNMPPLENVSKDDDSDTSSDPSGEPDIDEIDSVLDSMECKLQPPPASAYENFNYEDIEYELRELPPSIVFEECDDYE